MLQGNFPGFALLQAQSANIATCGVASGSGRSTGACIGACIGTLAGPKPRSWPFQTLVVHVLLGRRPAADEPPRYVLEARFVIGTQWLAPITSHRPMRRNGFPRETRPTHPSVSMRCQTEAADETVTAPAARSEHCPRVRGPASVRACADPASGWRGMPLTTLEWYGPGVGPVRLECSEPVKSAFPSGGTRALELESWQ